MPHSFHHQRHCNPQPQQSTFHLELVHLDRIPGHQPRIQFYVGICIHRRLLYLICTTQVSLTNFNILQRYRNHMN